MNKSDFCVSIKKAISDRASEDPVKHAHISGISVKEQRCGPLPLYKGSIVSRQPHDMPHQMNFPQQGIGLGVIQGIQV